MAEHSEDSAPTLCRRCWCVTWTSDLGRCRKCGARKEDGVADLSGSSAGGEQGWRSSEGDNR